MQFNTGVLSLYTPKTFPITNREEYDRVTTKGFADAKKEKVVIATMVRDVYRKLPQIIKKIERTGELFGDYRVLVVENDSTDGTRGGLLEWARSNDRVKILGCGVNVDECKIPSMPKTEGHSVTRGRIQKMVDLRNIYLDEIRNGDYSDYAYTIAWDTDLIGSVYLDGIANSIGWFGSPEGKKIDAICANGIYRWLGHFNVFYDTYALLEKGEKFHIDDKLSHDIRKGLTIRLKRGEGLKEVDSCFSGFSIYRTDALLGDGVKYEMSSGDEVLCEHVSLCKALDGKKMINPSMICYVLLND